MDLSYRGRTGAIARKGTCTLISRSFARSADIVAWPVQRRFAHRGKFQKLFNDRGEMISNLWYSTSFPRNQKQQCKIPYISYKKLRYTFDKFAEKIDGRVLFPSPHVKACDFLGFVEHFFSETLHDNLPVARAKQLSRSKRKTTSCKKATGLPR